MVLSLHTAGGKARDNVLLEDQHQQNQRYSNHDGCCRHIAPGQLIIAGEQCDTHRHRPHFFCLHKRKGIEILVPAVDKHQQTYRENRRLDQRKDDPDKGLSAVAAIDGGSLLIAAVKLAEEAGEKPDGHRQRERDVGNDQTCIGIQKFQVLQNQIQGRQGRDGREHGDAQNTHQQNLAALKAQPGKGIGSGGTHTQAEQGGADRHKGAVEQIPGKGVFGKDIHVEIKVNVAGDPFGRHGRDLVQRFDRRQELPDKGQQQHNQKDHNKEVEGNPAQTLFCFLCHDVASLVH